MKRNTWRRRIGILSLAFIGVAAVIIGFAFHLPLVQRTWVIVGGIFLLCVSMWIYIPSKKERREWFRLSIGVFLAALLGFVLSSVLSSQEEDKARRVVKENLEAAVVQEIKDVTARVSTKDAWDITPQGAESPVSLVGLTYLSSETLRQAAISGLFPDETSRAMLELANNIEMYNTIVHFALDVVATALHAPSFGGLLETVKDNLDRGRDKILNQSALVLKLLNGNETLQ